MLTSLEYQQLSIAAISDGLRHRQNRMPQAAGPHLRLLVIIRKMIIDNPIYSQDQFSENNLLDTHLQTLIASKIILSSLPHYYLLRKAYAECILSEHGHQFRNINSTR